jgi:hypothetical protein
LHVELAKEVEQKMSLPNGNYFRKDIKASEELNKVVKVDSVIDCEELVVRRESLMKNRDDLNDLRVIYLSEDLSEEDVVDVTRNDQVIVLADENSLESFV